MRSRHPFPDVPLEFEEPPTVPVRLHPETPVIAGGGAVEIADPGWTTPECTDWTQPPTHPDYCEKGTELPLGWMPHQGENRQQRREAVANWQPPKQTNGAAASESAPDGASPEENAAQTAAPAERMPTRRELWAQRVKHRRGKLDPKLRRLQRRKAKTK